MKVVAVAAAAALAAAAVVVALSLRHDAPAAREARVVGAGVRPGRVVVTLRNDGSTTVRIAQVMVNDAFVDFSGRLAVAAGRSTELVIPYGWVPGETYEVGVVTGDGEILDGEIEHAGEA